MAMGCSEGAADFYVRPEANYVRGETPLDEDTAEAVRTERLSFDRETYIADVAWALHPETMTRYDLREEGHLAAGVDARLDSVHVVRAEVGRRGLVTLERAEGKDGADADAEDDTVYREVTLQEFQRDGVPLVINMGSFS